MDIWKSLKKENRPVVLYGTGNGADMIIDILDVMDIPVSGIFASSSFVRERSFRGIRVSSYEECKERFPDMLVLMCFGSSRPEVMENVKRIKSEFDILVPDVPVYGNRVFTDGYYISERNRFLKIREKLSDAKSVKTFDSLIKYKLTGNIDLLFSSEEKEEDVINLLCLPDDSKFMDFGAYNGDTVRYYNDIFKFKHITAVEPDGRNFRKLKENTADIKNISYYNGIISDKDGSVSVYGSNGRGVHEISSFTEHSPAVFKKDEKGNDFIYVSERVSKRKENIKEITAFTADGILHKEKLSKNDKIFIKADVEGCELDFIKGAENLIRDFSPVMRIACYHRSEDYIEIPETVLAVNPRYKIYMRHIKGIPAWDTDYIFVPE